MRLRSVWISDYKNLKDFSIAFEGDGFVDIFVGKNGSGKSNFLEALIEIFDHIWSTRAGDAGPDFDYDLRYEVTGKEVHLSWREGDFSVDGTSGRQSLGQTPSPQHLLIYYSGQNETVSQLVGRYERQFRDRLREADGPIAPKIIGIGPQCRKLLIATLLMLPETSLARNLLCRKLGILGCTRSIELRLSKPFFIQRADHDPFEPDQLLWGVTGYIRTFLDSLIESIEGESTPGQLYDREREQYSLKFNVDRLNEILGDESGIGFFRSLDALRALDMLDDIRLPVTLEGLEPSRLDLFSDGQFQSVYLFGIAELFKELNCIALLDEPDAFLHPEWQFEFLSQVREISEQAAQTNHFLMTSHSASTIAAQAPGRIRLFELQEGGPNPIEQPKEQLISSLSAGLITFSHKEAKLNIRQTVRNTTKPILFTEGVSDEMILETAWIKLNPDEDCPFEVQSAFSASFLSVLLSDQSLYDDNPNRKFFGIFDFDDAYNAWNINGEDIERDPAKCLTRKREHCEGYSMLLPVPEGLSIRNQIINPETGEHYKSEARLTIELLFKDVPGLEAHFETDPTRPGNCVRFKGKKTRFASRSVPNIAAEHFEAFRPIFEFVQAEIATD